LRNNVRAIVSISAALLVACTSGGFENRDAGSARLVRAGEIPCAPRAVLANVCHNCHTDPPRNGAPFSQLTYQDIDTELDGEPVWSRMRRAVRDGRMPLDPWVLTDEERRVLLEWLDDDAPPAPIGTVCSP
jgi:hypothetical protein